MNAEIHRFNAGEFACTIACDGTPRVVPLGFHWDGQEIVLGTPPDAPKIKVLQDGTNVALLANS